MRTRPNAPANRPSAGPESLVGDWGRFAFDDTGTLVAFLVQSWGTVDLLYVQKYESPIRELGDGRSRREDALTLPTVDLSPLSDVAGTDCPLALQFRVSEIESVLYPFEVLLETLVVRINQLYYATNRQRRKTTAPAGGWSISDVQHWADRASVLADEVGTLLGEATAERMREAAAAVTRALAWRSCLCKSPTDYRGWTEQCLSVHIWALDVLLRAFAGTERERMVDKALAPALDALETFNLLPDPGRNRRGRVSGGRPGSEAWKMRISRIKKTIAEGKRDALMATVLQSLIPGEVTR